MNLFEAITKMRTCDALSVEVINCISYSVETMAEMIDKVHSENERLKAEKLERENPQPLGLEELIKMDGEPVWSKDFEEWMIVYVSPKNGIKLISVFGGISAKSVFKHEGVIYRHKPKHIGEANEMVEGE